MENLILITVIVAVVLLIIALLMLFKNNQKEKAVQAVSSTNETDTLTIISEPRKGENLNKNRNLLTILFATVGFLGSAICIFAGFYKIYVYENYSDEDYLIGQSKNAYVGGDAYNYIINGTYATAYFVLALICMLFACTMLVLNAMSKR